MNKHPNADVLVTFASLRSAYESTLEALEYPQVYVVTSIVLNLFWEIKVRGTALKPMYSKPVS